jgi:hypothetical protein
MQILPIDFPIPDEPPVIKTTLPISIAICARRVQNKKKSSRRKTKYCFKFRKESENQLNKNGKRPTSHRSTTYPAMFPSWGVCRSWSCRTCWCKYTTFYIFARALIIKNIVVYWYIKKRNYENYNFLSIILLGILSQLFRHKKK